MKSTFIRHAAALGRAIPVVAYSHDGNRRMRAGKTEQTVTVAHSRSHRLPQLALAAEQATHMLAVAVQWAAGRPARSRTADRTVPPRGCRRRRAALSAIWLPRCVQCTRHYCPTSRALQLLSRWLTVDRIRGRQRDRCATKPPLNSPALPRQQSPLAGAPIAVAWLAGN